MSLVTEETEGDGGTLLGLAELDNEVDVSCYCRLFTLEICVSCCSGFDTV